MKKQLLIIAVLIATIFSAHAQFATVYSFTGSTDGVNPDGDLLFDGTFLYGTTISGGANGMGSLFKVKPDGTGYMKFLDFDNLNNGRRPKGALITDGTFLYGMTSMGGVNQMGVIFKIMPDGTGYVKLLDFANGVTTGNKPLGSLTLVGTVLYGMASAGGTATGCTGGCGTLFKINTDGTGFTKIFDFTYAANGGTPMGTLSYDGTYLYGMTEQGGGSGGGAIFKIKPDGSGFALIHSFQGTSTNGGNPQGSPLVVGDTIFGMVQIGGVNSVGALFRLMTDGTGYSEFYNFSNTPNGLLSALISDGTYLYGLSGTDTVGVYGSMFKIKSDGTGFTKIHKFSSQGTDGRDPEGSLISDGTYLYGTTDGGGSGHNGIVFKYNFVGGAVAAAPTNLTVTPLRTSTATGDLALLWTDNASNETGFKIERSPDGTSGWTLIDSTAANIVNYTNTGLSAGSYYYRVAAYNAAGLSPYSNVASGTTAGSTGISFLEQESGVSIFPNPSAGKFTVLSLQFTVSSVEVYNILGEKLFSQYSHLNTQFPIDISKFGKGIYFVRLKTDQGIITKKIVVN